MWVHIVCVHEKIQYEVQLNICSRGKKQLTFSGPKNSGGITVKALHAGKFCMLFAGCCSFFFKRVKQVAKAISRQHLY